DGDVHVAVRCERGLEHQDRVGGDCGHGDGRQPDAIPLDVERRRRWSRGRRDGRSDPELLGGIPVAVPGAGGLHDHRSQGAGRHRRVTGTDHVPEPLAVVTNGPASGSPPGAWTETDTVSPAAQCPPAPSLAVVVEPGTPDVGDSPNDAGAAPATPTVPTLTRPT